MISYNHEQINEIEQKCKIYKHLGEEENLSDIISQDKEYLDTNKITIKQIKDLFEKIKYHMDYNIDTILEDSNENNNVISPIYNLIWNYIDTHLFNGMFHDHQLNKYHKNKYLIHHKDKLDETNKNIKIYNDICIEHFKKFDLNNWCLGNNV